MVQLPVEILATLNLGNGVEKAKQNGQIEQYGRDERNGKSGQNVS